MNSPTLRMWSSRVKRLRVAWHDPSAPRAPLPKWAKALYSSQMIYFAVTLPLIYSLWVIKGEYLTVDSWILYGKFSAILIPSYIAAVMLNNFLHRPRSHEDGMVGACFMTAVIMMIVSGVTFFAKNQLLVFQPATQETFSRFVQADPTCERYRDYLDDRRNKEVILRVEDLLLARSECIRRREKQLHLEAQKALKP